MSPHSSLSLALATSAAAPDRRQSARTLLTLALGALLAGFAALALLPAETLAQQEGVIRGSVLTPQAEAVPGANVQVLDTDLGTLVGDDGTYSLSVPAGQHRVAARALGYGRQVRTVTVEPGETVQLDFTLQVSAVQMQQIVASVEAGAGTQRRATGTDIATIDAASEVEKGQQNSFSNLLQGRSGNLTISTSSGNVGASSRIRIRGITSLTQDNQPLLIIDGVRANQFTGEGINRGQTFSRFDDLDPDNIQSVEVVKGPTATTLYGSEAAAGVIIVNTKRGGTGAGGAQVTVKTEHGFQDDVTPYRDNFGNVTQFVTGPDDPKLDGFRTATNPVTGEIFALDNPFEDEDTSPFRTARQSQGTVQARGGRQEEVAYFSSVAYENDQGVLPSNDQEKLDLRVNATSGLGELLDLNLNAGFTSSETNLPKSGGNTSGFFANAEDGVPASALGANGQCLATVLTDGGFDPSFCDKNGNVRAAFDKIEAVISKQDLERFTTSLNANVDPTDWLSIRATAGGDISNTEFDDAIPFDPDIPFSFAAGGEAFRTRTETRVFTGDYAMTARYPITGKLSGNTTAGAQYFQDKVETTACEGRVFVNDQATACDAAASLRGFSDFRERVEIGTFFQHRFNWNDYAFVTGALRVDDNSALGDRADEIYSPSVNTSLVLSDAPFWNVPFISNLQLRFAWGKASQAPQQFAADRNFGIIRLERDGEIILGVTPEDPGNPDLAEEETEEFEGGFNLGLLDDRIALDFTFFERTTDDLIVSQPVPPSSGFPNDRFVNIGELDNDGFEAALDALVFDRDKVSMSVNFTWSTNDPVITDLAGEGPIFIGFSQVLAEGAPPGAITSRVISSAERDGAGNIIPGSIERLPGQLGDGSGRRIVGFPDARNTQSLSTTLNFLGAFRAFMLFERKGGHSKFMDSLEGRNGPGDPNSLQEGFGQLWAFRQQLDPVTQAMIEQDRLVGEHDAVFVRDASFVKLREATISWDLPSTVTRLMSAADARLFIGGRELFTVSDFPKFSDPDALERGARDNLISVVDNTLPPPIQFFGGLEFSF